MDWLRVMNKTKTEIIWFPNISFYFSHPTMYIEVIHTHRTFRTPISCTDSIHNVAAVIHALIWHCYGKHFEWATYSHCIEKPWYACVHVLKRRRKERRRVTLDWYTRIIDHITFSCRYFSLHVYHHTWIQFLRKQQHPLQTIVWNSLTSKFVLQCIAQTILNFALPTT